MLLAKWSNLAVGLAGALVTGAVLVFAQGSSPQVEVDPILAMGAALLVGLLLATTHWLIFGRLESEVRRLASHIETLGTHDSRHTSYQAGAGFAELARVMERTLGDLRSRCEALISQRRELEIQARTAEGEARHAQAALNAIADAVIVTDAFNEVTLANDAATRILELDRSDLVGHPADMSLTDPLLTRLLRDARQSANPLFRRRLEQQLGHDHSESLYEVTVACISDAPEPQAGLAPREPTGVVAILRDITREKAIAETKSEFVATVSHELRTPLSSIKAYMEMLLDGEATDEQSRLEFYNIIQGETNRLSRLIDNILNISRIESGVIKVQREIVSLPAVIKDALDVMHPQARAKQIKLIEVPTPLFFQVYADRDMIYQAVLNLLGNAIKYTPDGGRVTVSIAVDEQNRLVNVAVKDTGVGVPAVDMPHLFEKFYRVTEHKKMAKGTGLGLNLVKHIVETVHGGKISVASQPGQGSTFMFSLPMADSEY